MRRQDQPLTLEIGEGEKRRELEARGGECRAAPSSRSTIVTTPMFGPAPVLISGSTHILLNPTTLRGTFKTLEIVTFDDSTAVRMEHTAGTVTIVPCP